MSFFIHHQISSHQTFSHIPQDAASGSSATELPEDPQLGVMEVIIGPAFETRSGMGKTWENGH